MRCTVIRDRLPSIYSIDGRSYTAHKNGVNLLAAKTYNQQDFSRCPAIVRSLRPSSFFKHESNRASRSQPTRGAPNGSVLRNAYLRITSVISTQANSGTHNVELTWAAVLKSTTPCQLHQSTTGNRLPKIVARLVTKACQLYDAFALIQSPHQFGQCRRYVVPADARNGEAPRRPRPRRRPAHRTSTPNSGASCTNWPASTIAIRQRAV